MEFEEKVKWVKRFMGLMGVLAGVVMAKSLIEGDYTLFIAGLSLGVGSMAFQVMIGFIDALLREGP